MEKISSASLSGVPGVRHGFFTRNGGVSGGIYASLNCGPGSADDALLVAENRARVAQALGAGNLMTLRQVHSATVITVDRYMERGELPEADALVTAVPGIAIGALAADCAPVLFAAKDKKIIGAAHAGWKGAIGGVLENTIERMREMGAKDIAAAVGPCIGPRSYEVSEVFSAPFLSQDAGNERFFREAVRPGHLMFDLPGYVVSRLRLAGLTDIEDTRRDTLPDEKTFFSYRRATLRGEAEYGRQVSAIAIAP